YTGNFDVTYQDVCEGCKGLLEYIRKNQGNLL
ncbi:MAG TPA: protein tyrosine phosphatase, partial [Lachnospiraceae bacterium]|nr:protein tyrosine phosphatase [Lachnospiraceae bacterium]